MQIHVQLSPVTERALRAKAAALGQSLEDYMKTIAEREADTSNGTAPAPISSDVWSAEWRAWGEADRKLPPGINLDDSRESIYAGRGE